MDAINSGDEPDHDLISTEMLEDISDGSQNNPNVNRTKKYIIKYLIVLGKDNQNGKER